jgi:hypothetical protein
VTTTKPSDPPLTYCERWNTTLKKPIGVISEDEAAARNESGQLFSVVVGDLAQPDALLEIRWETQYAAVWLFDDKARRTLNYTFTRVDAERLFLSGVTTWTFSDEALGRQHDAWRIEWLTFSQDGVVHREVKDKTTGDTLVEDYSDVDVVKHWQAVPEFAGWAPMTRTDYTMSRERGEG